MRAKGGGQRKTKTLEVSLFSVTALSFSNNMIVFREGIYFLGPQPHKFCRYSFKEQAGMTGMKC